MRPGRLLAALLCGALLLLAGCGSDNKGKPIPSDQADKMIRAIQAADQYNADGKCARAKKKVVDARFLLTKVPDSVDPDVRQGIDDGLAHMNSLIASECQKPETNTDTTPTTTTVTQTQTTQTQTQTQTTPTATDTTPTATQPTTTTPTSTAPTTTGTGGTPPPPGNGAAGAGGDGQ